MVQFDFPDMKAKEYDQVWQDLRNAGHANPKGLIHHVGAPTEKGMKVVDIWESAEKFNEFGKTLMPILTKQGFKATEPVVLPIYTVYDGGKSVLAS